MFRIITISRDHGSGGAEIARELAERLGWQLIDLELVTEIARRANVDRRHFGADWKDSRLYHVVLNSSIGVEPAVRAILSAAGLAAENR